MNKIAGINNQFFLSILIIALGYAFKRLKLIQEEDGDSVSRIIFNITLPALIIYSFSSMKLNMSLGLLTILGLVYGLLMSVLGIFAFKREPKNIRGALTMVIPGLNIGLFAYPLVQSLWGNEGLKYFGMFDMGNSITMFVFCYLLAAYYSPNGTKIDGKKIWKALLTSVPLMCYLIVLAVNILGIQIPSPIFNVTGILSKANMPLSLLLLGIYLNFSFEKTYLKYMLKILLYRYSIGLIVGIALFLFLPYDLLFRHTLLIGFSLPIGMAVIPYAVQFHYDKKFVGTLCNTTIVISFFLIWMIVSLTPA